MYSLNFKNECAQKNLIKYIKMYYRYFYSKSSRLIFFKDKFKSLTIIVNCNYFEREFYLHSIYISLSILRKSSLVHFEFTLFFSSLFV